MAFCASVLTLYMIPFESLESLFSADMRHFEIYFTQSNLFWFTLVLYININ